MFFTMPNCLFFYLFPQFGTRVEFSPYMESYKASEDIFIKRMRYSITKELEEAEGNRTVRRKVKRYLQYPSLSEFLHIVVESGTLQERNSESESEGHEQELFKLWICVS